MKMKYYKMILIVLIAVLSMSQDQKVKHSFTDLNDAMKHPNEVIDLYLVSKGYQNFPKEILKFKNLTSLYLSRNPIKTIPDSIIKLKKLKTLDLNSCKLSSLPDGISKLQNLKILNLMNNKINSIPKSLCGLDSLYLLNFIGNPIQDYPPCFLNMKNLKILCLADFNTDSLPMPREKVFLLWKTFNAKLPEHYWDIFEYNKQIILNNNE